MATFVKSVDELEKSGHVNGLSFLEIERRARPLDDKQEDPKSYHTRSHVGFLDAKETFVQRLRVDWSLVGELGLTHIELAHHVREAIRLTERVRSENRWAKGRPVEIDAFHPTSYPDSYAHGTLRLGFERGPQRLRVERRSFAGHQHSLFKNDAVASAASTSPSSDAASPLPETATWNEDYVISNLSLPVLFPDNAVTIAGNDRAGIVNYIEHYGFYEGGSMNPYRADPAVLVAVLAGRITSQFVRTIEERIGQLQKDLEMRESNASILHAELIGEARSDEDEKRARGWLDQERQAIANDRGALHERLQALRRLQV